MALDYGDRSVHLTFGGTLFLAETWSCGLRIAAGNDSVGVTPTVAQLQDFAGDHIDDVATKVGAYWTAISTVVSTKAKLGWVKMAAVDTDGLMSDTGIAQVHTFATPTAGGGGNQWPQLALAISLTTGVPRGRAHTGRYYLPFGTQYAPDSVGQLTNSDAVTIANWSAEFISALNDWEGIDPLWDPRVHVMSGLGTGTKYQVTGVRVGRVPDTQRRRRSSIPEAYAVATTAVTG